MVRYYIYIYHRLCLIEWNLAYMFAVNSQAVHYRRRTRKSKTTRRRTKISSWLVCVI